MFITVLHCVSWGYARNVKELANYIERENPGLIVDGKPYPIGAVKELLVKILGFAQIALMIFSLFGESICGKFGIPTPRLYYMI